LTPGTGTTRRKRVSFGQGVKEGAEDTNPSASGIPDECPGKFPSPWKDNANSVTDDSGRPKTRLTQAMENARKNRASETGNEVQELDDVWEEVDEEESELDGDMTVDLNEPHSRSGKYWKSHFEQYHTEARTEMEKLVKYKQLAKSYAKKKDEEAIDLNQKLKEEQEKVRKMEKKVSEMGRQVALRAKKSGGQYDSGLMDELTKQTALALEYKKQVEELESLLLENAEDEVDGVLPRQRRIASPRTQKTLLETQRELRRARSQAKELDRLKEERDRLRSELKFAEQRVTKLADENRKLSEDLTQSMSKALTLDKALQTAKSEALQKDDELETLKKEHSKLKDDAKARYVEARQVLQKKNEMISELQGEVVTLRAEGLESRWTSRAKKLEAKLKSGNEEIQAPDHDAALKFLVTAEEESTQLLRELGKLRKASIQRGLIAPMPTSGARPKSGAESWKSDVFEDEALVSSRALRGKIEAEMGKRDLWALGDRGNLQDSRSSASSGRSAHIPEDESSRPSRQAERKSWTAGLTSLTTAVSKTKPTIDDIFSDLKAEQHRRKSMPVDQIARRQTPGPPASRDDEMPQIDLVQDSFAPLGAADPHSSVMWTMNTSRTTLPPDRQAAALARLERKRAERARGDRNKENARPF